MTALIRFTENLDLDTGNEMWLCHTCAHPLISARENYKRGCLVAQRDPRDVHEAVLEGPYSFAPDPEWVRILEFYCPGCGRQIETEYLPPGHPITHDIELDVDSLKARLKSGDLVIRNGKLVVGEESGMKTFALGSKSAQTCGFGLRVRTAFGYCGVTQCHSAAYPNATSFGHRATEAA